MKVLKFGMLMKFRCFYAFILLQEFEWIMYDL